MNCQFVNTGLYIPLSLHRLLRAAVRGRQDAASGIGHASVSALITELIQRHFDELESDARRSPAEHL